MTDPRWKAVVTYRSTNGPVGVEYDIDELDELHDLIEHGPDWNTIESIVVTLAGPTDPGLTVEEAAAR